MDIRQSVIGVLVGGSPAPGINAVISAISIEAFNNGVEVIGFLYGFKKLRHGHSHFRRELHWADVSSVHSLPGSILSTSFAQLETPQQVDNALRVFEHLRIRYLITIGGIQTAFSSHLLNMAAQKSGFEFSVCHVPKTVFNDLPLPRECKAFGFSTARDYGVELLKNLRVDAKTLRRWYIVTLIGQRAGHLSLGIAKGAASTVTLIPEDFEGGVDFETIADTIEASMLKRYVYDRDFGIAVITQGLVNIMKPDEVKKLFGTVEKGYLELSSQLATEMRSRFEKKRLDICVFSRFIGSEIRSAPPNATDVSLARDLGYCATRNLLDGDNGKVVASKGGVVSYIPLTEMVDAKTGAVHVRQVDKTTLSFEVACKYQVRLLKRDLVDPKLIQKMSEAADMTESAFLSKYKYVAL